MESGSLDALQNEHKYLTKQLEFWEEAVKKSRDDCYLLNTFTAKQILLLRKELKAISQLECAELPSHFQCLNLLRNIFPCFSIEDIVNITQSSNHHHINSQNDETIPDERSESFVPLSAAVRYLTYEDIVEECFSEVERKIYIGLTSTYGFHNLLAITEVIQSKVNLEISTDAADDLILSIGEKMLNQEHDEEIDKGLLTILINEYLQKTQANACFGTSREQVQKAEDASLRTFSKSQTAADENSEPLELTSDINVLPDLPKEDIVFGM